VVEPRDGEMGRLCERERVGGEGLRGAEVHDVPDLWIAECSGHIHTRTFLAIVIP
jgi:hypothetical protein